MSSNLGRTVFQTKRRVEFRDTDAAGIMHFSAFFPMMESAEHEFLRYLGLSVMPSLSGDSAAVTWPRVAASCDYHAAARFEDIMQIDVSVLKLGQSSVRYGFQFAREPNSRIGREQASTSAEKIASGILTVVCCHLNQGGHLTKTEIPEDVRKLLGNHEN